MASCAYLAPNGERSELFSEIAKNYNAETAVKTFVFVNSHRFNAHRGAVEFDHRGEPTLKSLEESDLLQVIYTPNLQKPFEADANFKDKKEGIEANFNLNGSHVTVEENTTQSKTAVLSGLGIGRRITINPTKMDGDSKLHKFGHALVDILRSMNPDAVESGLEKLRNSALWTAMRKLYPDMSLAEFENEVLTTAIGMQGSMLFEGDAAKEWDTWKNRMARKLGDELSLTQPEALALAESLTAGDVEVILANMVSNYEQHKRDFKLVNNNFRTKREFLEDLKKDVIKKIKILTNRLSASQQEGDLFQDLKQLEELLLEHDNINEAEGIIQFLETAIKQIAIIENTIAEIEADRTKATPENLLRIQEFAAMYNRIGDLIDLVKEDAALLAELETNPLSGVDTISHLASLKDRVDNIFSKTHKIGIITVSNIFAKKGRGPVEQKERKRLERVFNADHPEGVKVNDKVFKRGTKEYNQARREFIDNSIVANRDAIFDAEVENFMYLLQQAPTDINYADALFSDATNISDQIVQVAMEILREADHNTRTLVNDTYKEFDRMFEKYEKEHPEGNPKKKYEPLLENEVTLSEDGEIIVGTEPSGYMVTEYHSYPFVKLKAMWKQFHDFENPESKEAKDFLEEIHKFTNDNFERPYTQEFYTTISEMTDLVKEETQNLRKERSDILKQYRNDEGTYDAMNMTPQDYARVQAINDTLKDMAQGRGKSGRAAQLAAELKAYNKAVGKLFEELDDFDMPAFTAAKRHARSQGVDFFNEWKRRNTKDGRPAKNWKKRAIKKKYVNREFDVENELKPKEKWKSEKYAQLQREGGVNLEMYDFLINNIRAQDAKNVPPNSKLIQISRRNKDIELVRLPYVARETLERVTTSGGVMQAVKQELGEFTQRKSDTKFGTDPDVDSDEDLSERDVVFNSIRRSRDVLVNEQGEEKQRVPINFRHYKYKEDGFLDTSDMSFDLLSINMFNTYMSENYKNKREIEATMLLTKELLGEREVIQTELTAFRGQRAKKDVVTGRVLTTKGRESNVFQMFSSVIQDQLFGISSLGPVALNQIGDKLLAWTGNITLMINWLSAGANVIQGSLQNFFEAIGSTHYNREDLKEAWKDYWSDLPNITGDLNRNRYRSKTNLLMEKFNTLSDWGGTFKHFMEDSLAKRLFKSDTLHGLQTMGEHMMQNQLMYAIMNSSIVLNEEGQMIDMQGEVTTDVKKAMRLKDAYTINEAGDELELHPAAYRVDKFEQPLREGGEFLVSQLIRDVNADLQGQYDTTLKSQAQRAFWGKAVMMFRKWIPRGIKRRFRHINTIGLSREEMTEMDVTMSRFSLADKEGIYTTTARHYVYPHVAYGVQFVKQVIGLQDAATKLKYEMLKVDWASLSDQEQANIRKAVAELATAALAFGIAAVAKGLGDDEEPGSMSRTVLFGTAFFTRRLYSELTFYLNPIEFTRILRSPAISLNMIEKILHFLGQLLFDPLERYKSGRRKDELKIKKDVQDIVPIIKQFDRNIEEAVNFVFKPSN